MRRRQQSLGRPARIPGRLGAALALLALVGQLLLPGAAARTMGAHGLLVQALLDQSVRDGESPPGAAAIRAILGDVPICAGLAGTGAPDVDHGKGLRPCCPLCQAPAIALGFLPPVPQMASLGPRPFLPAPWCETAAKRIGRAPLTLRARGPPALA